MNEKRSLESHWSESQPDSGLIQYINLRLALLGQPTLETEGSSLPEFAAPLLARNRETSRLLANYLCPVDWRIQHFLDEYLYDTGQTVVLPRRTFILDAPKLARVLSLPPNKDEFESDIVHSYRLRQGVLHNPASDRRTTQGVFHVVEGGLPIPDDKQAVPKGVYARLLQHAFNPPDSLLQLPFTAGQEKHAQCFVSLLLRPIVCPEVPGFIEEKSMEIRFFVPGNLVSNLDFVESIFTNGGDPYLPENDAALDVEHWTGHTGCVILAPHLVRVTKKELGLPHWDDATERQRRDGMCWKKPEEPYNNGSAFKITARDARGVMVTVIADNYYGYCKKEVKTQISFSANLFGLAEEEHAGGALVYASYDLGEEFSGDLHVQRRDHRIGEVFNIFSDLVNARPEQGYAIDKRFPEIIYVPHDANFNLQTQTVSWEWEGKPQSIRLRANEVYVRPSGYKVQMKKPSDNRAWRLIGTVAEPTLCHKPCTVSGGGKSEISKPITDAIIHGPVFIGDIQRDFDRIADMLKRDYSQRFSDASSNGKDHRPILSPERSLGSVIKLLTPAEELYSAEYNAWLNSIPQYIKELVFVLKRFYKPSWGEQWRDHFSVDIMDGVPGNELKCDGRKLVSNYLRVGYAPDGSWQVFSLRKDFSPAAKLQMEDDITASVVVPASALSDLNPESSAKAVKFVKNTEMRLFQRPDDAIHRGYDKQTEIDLSKPGNFLSNFEPLTRADAKEIVEDAIGFTKFTAPMQKLILDAATTAGPEFVVSSAHPRIVNGKPSKNPRYLQIRPDLLQPREVYLAEIATRLRRRIPMAKPLHTPVNAVVPGRRNNPPEPEAKIRPLAVYNPVHYMELPELFLEFICSLTGKSPSTTGAGSEGALTKGPFNALPPIIDLNAAIVSFLLTNDAAFVSAAGYVGPKVRVDHDISLLIPEVWCRMSIAERDPKFLIANGYLERCRDFTYEGKPVLASRLGWRITGAFVRAFFGRVFNNPHLVLNDAMLHPELQDMSMFADGMDNIVTTQKRVAESYFADGSVAMACPPLKALLHIMRDGQYEGKTLDHPEIRALFDPAAIWESAWYLERLKAKQTFEQNLWHHHATYLQGFLNKPNYADEAVSMKVKERVDKAWERYHLIKTPAYLETLKGTLGLQPLGA